MFSVLLEQSSETFRDMWFHKYTYRVSGSICPFVARSISKLRIYLPSVQQWLTHFTLSYTDSKLLKLYFYNIETCTSYQFCVNETEITCVCHDVRIIDEGHTVILLNHWLVIQNEKMTTFDSCWGKPSRCLLYNC